MDYAKELNRMYDQYYCGPNGHCKYWEKCKEGLLENIYPCKFFSDRVKIGERYGTNPLLPKIVFVGLEGVHEGYKNNPIPAIDYSNPISVPSRDASNNHYRGVRYVLAYLMAQFTDGKNNCPEDASIGKLEEVQDSQYLDQYCLTNIYKCAFGSGTTGLPHTKEMQQNCIEILLEELKILEPDILVIQVVTGRPTQLWSALMNKFSGSDIPLCQAKRNKNTSVHRLNRNGTPFYCVWTYHGNGGPYPYKRGGVFVNNNEYISRELNPVLDETARLLRADRVYTKEVCQ